MRTRQDVIDFCLSLDDTYEDYPFHDFNWTIMRHKIVFIIINYIES